MGKLKIVAFCAVSLLLAVIVACAFTFGIWLSSLIVLGLAGFLCALYIYAKRSKLSDRTLTSDLKSLQRAYGKYYSEELEKNFDADRVKTYYTHTTDRDYKLLSLFIGPGLHSRLEAPYPIGTQGSGTRQPSLILSEVRAANASRVLEIGCGRGHCSLYLAGAARDVAFEGIDLTPRHVEVASESASRSGLTNVSFRLADASKMETSAAEKGSFDVIFGVEALCHVDTLEGARAFSLSADRLLRSGGRVVIIDGFRSPTFGSCSKEQQTAMMLAESGFRIRAMPSKALWIDLFNKLGFRVLRDIDLTEEALPFWELGWRVARVALLFPRLVGFVMDSSAAGRETAANLLSVSTTAHAMRNRGSAEYGMIVLEKP